MDTSGPFRDSLIQAVSKKRRKTLAALAELSFLKAAAPAFVAHASRPLRLQLADS
jgi:hypothetical protein